MGDSEAVEYEVDVLFAAGKRNNTSLLNEYIAQKGAKFNPNEVDSLGNSSLHYSAGSNHMEVTQLLLSKGADPNIKNKTSGETPLHRAVWNGHTEIVKLLIEKGANPTIANSNGQKPLQLAKNRELKAIIDSAVLAASIDSSDVADDEDEEAPPRPARSAASRHEHDKVIFIIINFFFLFFFFFFFF